MTTQLLPVMDESITTRHLTQTTPSFWRLWASTLLVYILPRKSGRLWLDASLPRTSVVAAIHCTAGVVWLFLTAAAMDLCYPIEKPSPPKVQRSDWEQLIRVAWTVPGQIAGVMHSLSLLDRVAVVLGISCVIAVAFALPFFVLLPFAARPGPAKPCIRHVVRTVLLATGSVHLWGIAFVSIFMWLLTTSHGVAESSKGSDRGVAQILLAGTILGIWTLASLITAIRLDYRRHPADQPQPHDPWCDDCGYNLTAADPAGRCPECGRLVADSLGSQTRPPTAWERNPKVTNFPVIAQQLKLLVRHPRSLFFSMPTLTGQRAAQRWLLFSTLLIAAAASLIVPAWVVTGGVEWSAAVICGALAMGFVWALLAVMMVGIETAGVATVSRMRANREGLAGSSRGVYLATSAKVTCYSSILMVVWVLAGGAQLLIAFHYYLGPSAKMPTLSMWAQQILLASTLSVAHIGGLFWYEFTVYRGIRAIQFANK